MIWQWSGSVEHEKIYGVIHSHSPFLIKRAVPVGVNRTSALKWLSCMISKPRKHVGGNTSSLHRSKLFKHDRRVEPIQLHWIPLHVVCSCYHVQPLYRQPQPRPGNYCFSATWGLVSLRVFTVQLCPKPPKNDQHLCSSQWFLNVNHQLCPGLHLCVPSRQKPRTAVA